MTVRRRWAVRGLRAGALAALLAYAAGRYASRSGGLVEVERLLDRPVLLLGAAVVLLVVSAVLGIGARTGSGSGARAGFVQIAVAVVLAPLVAASAVGAVSSRLLDGGARSVERKVHPDHPERVLTVTGDSSSIDSTSYRAELLTGTGWSARHWTIGSWDGGRDRLRAVECSTADRITVTTAREVLVFTLGPDGDPGRPAATPR
ncbi:hypothetical protein ACFC1T_03955 [Kitasatospora sp. NPDC056076]|uniref:hypothetical protein n=1 Tax=Kitasatospora sp. NPDC056076 TaxID=3345703 RepID=UPI0035D90078